MSTLSFGWTKSAAGYRYCTNPPVYLPAIKADAVDWFSESDAGFDIGNAPGLCRHLFRSGLPRGFDRGSLGLAAKTDLLGQHPALLGVVRRHHRIIAREPERLPIALRRVAMERQVTLEHLVGLAVDHADNVFGLHRGAHRHRTLGLFWFCGRGRLAYTLQRPEHDLDEVRQIGCLHGIVGHMRRDDVSGQCD